MPDGWGKETMPTFSISSRKIIAITGSSADPVGQTASLMVEYEDAVKETLVFPASEVGTAVMHLLGRLGEAIGHLAPEDQPEVRTPELADIGVAMNQSGEIALSLLLKTENGQFPLVHLAMSPEVVSSGKTGFEAAAAHLAQRKRN
jgi:hypothetical protein